MDWILAQTVHAKLKEEKNANWWMSIAAAFYQVQKPELYFINWQQLLKANSIIFSNILYSIDCQTQPTGLSFLLFWILISKKSVAGPTPQGSGCQILLQCASSHSRQGQQCQCASIEPSHPQTAWSKINFQGFLGCEIIWSEKHSCCIGRKIVAEENNGNSSK